MGKVAILLLTLIGAIAALLAAALVPVHLRALDPRVMVETGRLGKTLLEATDETAVRNPAVAKVLLRAAENLNLAGTEQSLEILREAAHPRPAPRTVIQELERAAAGRAPVLETPVLIALRRKEDRERLAGSFRSPDAARILQNRALTNLTVFAPVSSGAGYPLDSAILATAFLIEQGAFGSNARSDTTIKDEIMQFSARGSSTNHVAALEEVYLDVFALAKRFSSEQLIAFVANIGSFKGLDRLTRFLQERPGTMPIIYSSVILSGDGDRVGEYLVKFPDTAVTDLRFALSEAGTHGVKELVARQRPVYRVDLHNSLISSSFFAFIADPLRKLAVAFPKIAFLLKWIFLLCSGLAFAYFVRLARMPDDSDDQDEEEGWVPQFGFVRRLTFATVFLALTVLLGEPYLAQGEAEEKPAPRVIFPVFSAVKPAPASASPAQPTGFMINPSTLVAMGVFLILQTSIYIFCLTKLAEIRRQPLSSPMKLKLLENEENLFDAGLYLGLFGTAASLILLTLGMIKPSLVSAYSSTLFGILYVALLKIFHVRPYKRRLIIDSDDEEVA